MRIETKVVLNYSDPKKKHSYQARPDMGVIKHFPRDVCEAMIAMGATEIETKKSSKEVKASKPAD